MNTKKGISIDKDTFKKFYFIKKREQGDMFYNIGRVDLKDRKWAKTILFSGANGSIMQKDKECFLYVGGYTGTTLNSKVAEINCKN